MTALTRRSFVNGSASLLLGRSAILRTGASALALTTASREANAWVMAALAIGSMVAGLIANNNRSDGGAMALLTANYELLKVALRKLDHIESQVVEILEDIKKLPDEIDRRLKQENTRRLEIELNAVIVGYIEKLNQKDPQQSFADWRVSKQTMDDVRGLLGRLQKSRQELKTEGMIDPATAIVVSPLAIVEHSLLNILQYRPAEIAATLNQVYMPWFDAILDPKNSMSAADYADGAASRLAGLMKRAAEHPLGKALSMRPGSTLLVGVGVNDITPAHKEETNQSVCTGRNYSSLEELEQETELPRPVSFRATPGSGVRYPAAQEANEVCRPIMRDVGARIGPRDRLAQDAILTEKEFVAPSGKASGLMLLDLMLSPERRGLAGTSDVPEDKQSTVVNADLRDPGARAAFMHKSKAWTDAHKSYEEFAVLIDAINAERTRFAFGMAAMVAVETAKHNINQIIRNYGR
jgi:hypothetical protein